MLFVPTTKWKCGTPLAGANGLMSFCKALLRQGLASSSPLRGPSGMVEGLRRNFRSCYTLGGVKVKHRARKSLDPEPPIYACGLGHSLTSLPSSLSMDKLQLWASSFPATNFCSRLPLGGLLLPGFGLGSSLSYPETTARLSSGW